MNNNTMTAPCPHCGRRLRFDDQALGHKGRCLCCNQRLAVLSDGRVYAIADSNKAATSGCPKNLARKRTAKAAIRTRSWDLSGIQQLALLGTAVLSVAMLAWSSAGPLDVSRAATATPASRPASACAEQPVSRSGNNQKTARLSRPAMVDMSWEPDAPESDRGHPSSTPDAPLGRGIIGPRAWHRPDLLRRGVTHCRQNRYAEGLTCFDELLAIDPGNAQAHCFRGRALSCLGRHAEAVIAYDRSLGIEPDRAAASDHRAVALASLK